MSISDPQKRPLKRLGDVELCSYFAALEEDLTATATVGRVKSPLSHCSVRLRRSNGTNLFYSSFSISQPRYGEPVEVPTIQYSRPMNIMKGLERDMKIDALLEASFRFVEYFYETAKHSPCFDVPPFSFRGKIKPDLNMTIETTGGPDKWII